MGGQDTPVPADAKTWLALWEAWLQDRGNDELAHVAGSYLLEVLSDRGVTPGRGQRPDALR